MRELNITEIQHISGGAGNEDVLDHVRSFKDGLSQRETTLAVLTGSFALVAGSLIKNRMIAGASAITALGVWYFYNTLGTPNAVTVTVTEPVAQKEL